MPIPPKPPQLPLYLLLAVASGLCAARPAMAQEPNPSRVLSHPDPVAGARFGEAVLTLDFDGDGHLDVAVGASGQDAAYVMFGSSQPLGTPDFEEVLTLRPPGATGPPSTVFGFRLAAGPLTGGPGDALAVGAPRTSVGGLDDAGAVYVYRHQSPTLELNVAGNDPGRLGASLAVGDFDHDGVLDIAAGAIQGDNGGVTAGRVYLFLGPLEIPRVVIIDSPFPVANGNFGHRLSAADVDGDGRDDLVVAAVGNDANGVAVAGQVFFYPGPVRAEVFDLIEDPAPDASDLPAPRFGMHVAASPGAVLTGAPRKNTSDVVDAGLGYVFGQAPDTPAILLEHPNPRVDDLLGFRVVVGNFTGSANIDYGVIVLANQILPGANPLGLLVWDGDAPSGPPATTFLARDDAEDHFSNGLAAGQLLPGGFDEVVFGDPSYDLPGTSVQDNAGRAVVYYPGVGQ